MSSVLIDAIGLVCPLPLIRLQQQLDLVVEGTEVILLADDPSTYDDIPFWCQKTGHRLVSIVTNDQRQFEIRVSKVAAVNPVV